MQKYQSHGQLYNLEKQSDVFGPLSSITNVEVEGNRVQYFWGRVSNFNQSEAREQCSLASDWLKFETLPRKYRTLLIGLIVELCLISMYTVKPWFGQPNCTH